MSQLITLTFEGTSADALYDMTVGIPEGATFILKQARVETTYTGDNYPRSINVLIGNTVNSSFVVDNDAGYNYFKIGLDQRLYTMADTTKRNISITYPDSGYKVSGRMDKSCKVSIFDTNHQPLSGLVYFFFQFVVLI